MKRIYFLAIVLLAASFAFAQNPEGGKGREGQGGRRQFTAEQVAQRQSNWMKKSLNLTEAQAVSVDSINLVYAKAQAALRQSSSGDRQAMRTAMQDLAAQKEVALTPVLTQEQMNLYKQQMSKMSERGNRGKAGFNRIRNNPDRQPNQNTQQTAE
jgi:hypothetical protein